MKYILILGLLIAAVSIAAVVLPSLVKKVLFILSFGAKLICGFLVATLLFEALSIDDTAFRMILGTIVITGVIFSLGSVFRLVAYSINNMSCSLLMWILPLILGDKDPSSFLLYAAALFVLSRVIWIIERFGEYDEYDHTEYRLFGSDVDYYVTHEHDFWGDSEGAWNLLPLQIIVALIFYSISALLIALLVHTPSAWIGPAIILSDIVNLLFDLFVFRYVDRECDGYVTES